MPVLVEYKVSDIGHLRYYETDLDIILPQRWMKMRLEEDTLRSRNSNTVILIYKSNLFLRLFGASADTPAPSSISSLFI